MGAGHIQYTLPNTCLLSTDFRCHPVNDVTLDLNTPADIFKQTNILECLFPLIVRDGDWAKRTVFSLHLMTL